MIGSGRSVRGVLAASLVMLCVAMPLTAFSKPLDLKTFEIRHFSALGGVSRLDFLGGLEITAEDDAFGGISGLRLDREGRRLFAVSDSAYWFSADIRRDDDGRVIGLADADYSCLCRASGEPYGSKHWGDAESVEIAGDRAFIAYERLNRINTVKLLDRGRRTGPPRQATASFSRLNIAYNGGLEAVALAPPGLPIAGRLIAIAEESLDEAGNHRGFIASTNGEAPIETFSVERRDGFNITDAVFLPVGDLLILERRFGFGIGLDMRIRRLPGDAIRAGATLDGPVLIEAGLASGIDNMEGIAVSREPRGGTRITVISDDNFSMLQRTLLLEFRLPD